MWVVLQELFLAHKKFSNKKNLLLANINVNIKKEKKKKKKKKQKKKKEKKTEKRRGGEMVRNKQTIHFLWRERLTSPAPYPL